MQLNFIYGDRGEAYVSPDGMHLYVWMTSKGPTVRRCEAPSLAVYFQTMCLLLSYLLPPHLIMASSSDTLLNRTRRTSCPLTSVCEEGTETKAGVTHKVSMLGRARCL